MYSFVHGLVYIFPCLLSVYSHVSHVQRSHSLITFYVYVSQAIFGYSYE